MSFQFRPAARTKVPLLIGIAGPSGGGKTMSALRLARGLAGDEKFCVIDSESGRAQMYSDVCPPWDHGDLTAPFSPEHYVEAIGAADDAGYPVIVVDSFSHEHAGDGGLLDAQSAELDRMAGSDWKKRDTMAMAAWVRPKQSHKRLMAHLLQLRAHLVICLRAEAKVEVVKDDRGKIKVVPKRSMNGVDGWIPVTEKSVPFELSMSLLVTPEKPGYPKPIKLPEMFKTFVPLDQPIGEHTGRLLAEWAGGSDEKGASAELTELITELLEVADQLGKREATTAAVTRDRQKHAHNLGAHAEFLRGLIERGSALLAEQEAAQEAEPDDDPFEELPPAEQLPAAQPPTEEQA